MKKIVMFILSVFLLICISSSAQAAGFDVYEYYGGSQYVQNGDTYNFGFCLAHVGCFYQGTNSSMSMMNDVGIGYSNPIVSARLKVKLWSQDYQPEKTDINFTAYYNGITYDIFEGWWNKTILNSSQIQTIEYEMTGDLLAAIQEDPYGNLSIRANNIPCYLNDFQIREVGMGATAVPEPATMLLLGVGLVGLAGVSRKKLKKQ